MPSIASVSIKFLADLKGFSSQMQNANRKIASVGKTLQNTGRKFSTNFTAPVLAGLALVTKGTEELRADLGRLNTNAELAGVGVEFMREQLQEVNAITGEVDSSVEGLSNLLATGFTGDGLSSVLDSLSGAAIRFSDTLKFEGLADGLQETLATGKAIGPFSELLERSGVNLNRFNKGLNDSIRAGTQQNFVLQTLASTGLAQVNKQYRENNKDVVEARKSQLAFQLAIADLGRLVQPIATKLTELVTQLVTWFTELSPTTQKFIAIIAGVGAAIGPLLTLAGTILPAIATGFTILTGPIGLIVAGLTAIGVVIVKNWQPIKGLLIDIANYFIDLYNESTVVRVGVQAIITTFKNLFDVGRFAFETLKNIIGSFIDNVVNGFKTFGRVVKAIFTGNFSQIPDILKENVSEGVDTFKGFTQELKNDWKNLTDNIKQNGQDAIEAITTRNKIEFLKDDVDASGVEASVSEAVQTGLAKGLSNNALSGGTPQVSALSSISSTGPQEVTTASPLDGIVAALPTQLAIVDENLLAFQVRLNEFNEAATTIIESTAESFAVGFANVIVGIANGVSPLAAIGKLILTTIGDLLQQLGKAAIQIGITMKAVKASFSSPFAAIATGTAAIVLGGLIKSLVPDDLQKFNDGGIVGGSSFVGDKILARVNSGELILNQRQQRNLLNQLDNTAMMTQTIIPDVRLEGPDILLSFRRTEAIESRRG